MKYDAASTSAILGLLDAHAAIDLPPSLAATATAAALRGLISASLARSTWSKYGSGWAAFCAFEAHHDASFPWPLSQGVVRSFVVWCISHRNLQPSTARSYLSALRFVGLLKGFPPPVPNSDPILTLLLTGATRVPWSRPPRPSTRRVVTLPLLITIGHSIASSSWDPISRQVVWTACTTAFFSSARLGELLASSQTSHDPTSDLLWRDVLFHSPSAILLGLKSTKSSDPRGEFLDLFPFPGHNCCPVKSLQSLRRKQVAAGLTSLEAPVFRFLSGSNLTTSHLNSILSNILSDICLPGENTISCHSFRAGIPSVLSLFPDLVSDDEIKGWGRWRSDSYQRYCRMQLGQKRTIFDKIAVVLNKSLA